MSYAREAIGWTLIHFCWQAAAIALLYRLADAVLRRSRSHVRYVAALTAMLAMLAMASATLIYETVETSHQRAIASSHRDQMTLLHSYASIPAASDPGVSAPDPG